jgi:DNA polymerase III subunit epsilon
MADCLGPRPADTLGCMDAPSPDLPLEEVDFAVVDVETTGLGAADRVIEVACIHLRGFQEVTRFQSLVNPGIAIAPAASAVSGITNEMVECAPIFPEIAESLEQLIARGVFVAHNAPFDLAFLSRERKRWQLPPWQGPVLDTLRLARNTIALSSYALKDLEQTLALDHAPAHRALADVLATASLLARLIERMEPRPRCLGELLQAQEPQPATWETCLALHPAVPLAILAEAAHSGQVVELEYQGRSGSAIYWIRPLAPEHNGPLYYLRAAMFEAEEERTFRLDRIVDVHIMGETRSSQATPRRPKEEDQP